MAKVRCNSCGSSRFEERKVDYLYSHQGKYLIVQNTPVEVCLDCGMMYYDGAVLEDIEEQFLSIYEGNKEPESYIKIPTQTYCKP
ncbi:type II toxin-antitoxin system MqsA family antitoxin [Baaleninema simplex]|uniref:type II toxin-antitoxin system MqsA family antitoxin n=1 Tax=Baaleninema simplex TaxID=2862350 RepID=UPI00034C2789|nr:type II toxin-antitoxin system MqsA family antitoxin [Baaleninema simplex]